MSDKALRYNEGKPKWGLVDFKSLIPLVRVLEYGARKYSPDNWKKGLDNTEILESLTRHLFCLLDGELVDEESGLEHIGHIMANAMFFSYQQHLPPMSILVDDLFDDDDLISQYAPNGLGT